jgi:hypothetical protein
MNHDNFVQIRPGLFVNLKHIALFGNLSAAEPAVIMLSNGAYYPVTQQVIKDIKGLVNQLT